MKKGVVAQRAMSSFLVEAVLDFGFLVLKKRREMKLRMWEVALSQRKHVKPRVAKAITRNPMAAERSKKPLMR